MSDAMHPALAGTRDHTKRRLRGLEPPCLLYQDRPRCHQADRGSRLPWHPCPDGRGDICLLSAWWQPGRCDVGAFHMHAFAGLACSLHIIAVPPCSAVVHMSCRTIQPPVLSCPLPPPLRHTHSRVFYKSLCRQNPHHPPPHHHPGVPPARSCSPQTPLAC